MLHWRHLIEVDDGEAVCLASIHIRHTEEEPLGVFVGVEVKAKVELIVPSATVTEEGIEGEKEGGREGGREAEREGRRREREREQSQQYTSIRTMAHYHARHSHLHSPCQVTALKPGLKYQRGAIGRACGCGLQVHTGTSPCTDKL